jgi:adenylate cyclase
LEAFVFGEVIPMAEEGFKRKLTAILSADVAGYSRLMAEDESATVKTLETYREVMSTLIIQHRGRVIDSPGDNLLAEFTSVVDAVQCAVAVQKEFQARNAEFPENRRMEFRIGVNLGDVIEEGERIYGDGVNIAARLEALADPGGICVSKAAFDHIESKLPLGYEYLGEQEVKNIPKPVGAYRVLMEPRITVAEEIEKVKAVPVWQRKTILAAAIVLVLVVMAVLIWNFYLRPPPMEVASVEKMAFPLPDKPSIAVLPFVNMSEDPKQEYFSDGLTEEIITGLSRVPNLFVIARHSTFSYKGKPVKVNQVSEELGVRYVLEGSVRKAADRVRITAQLIDALTGHHLWAGRYDRGLKDIFALQDEITKKIITALHVKLTAGKQASLDAKGTENLEAYLKYLEGQYYWRKVTPDDNVQARQLAEEVIALDPSYPRGYLLLGRITIFDVPLGLSKSRKKSVEEAFKLAQKVISMDASDSGGHRLLGGVYIMMRQHEKAIAARERAVALNPNHAENHNTLGRTLYYAGRPHEAIPPLKKAMRLNPHYPPMYLASLANAYWHTGRYEEALALSKELLERSLKGEYNPVFAHMHMAMNYIELGREAEARAHMQEILGIDPNWSLERYRKIIYYYKDPAVVERKVEALRKAGLPETPPLPLPDKPSIAVLPFVNMSGDPEQEYFSDGLTDEIITALSKSPRLLVIARESAFSYKEKHVKVKQVGRELGVRYVLEGSVRKSEDRVRITAKLIDALTEKHLWAERYDRPLGEIFAVQDEITLAIIKAMKVSLTDGEQARLIGKGTKNLDAYLKAIQAQEQFYLMNRQGSMKAKEFAKEAIALDPKYAFPYTTLALAHMVDVWFNFSKSPEESMRLAANAAQKALALDDSDPIVHSTLTNLYVMQRQYDKAIASAERDLELSPGGGRAHLSMGIALLFACRFVESITFFEQAVRLNPYPPDGHIRLLGSAYRTAGRYDEALSAYKKALQLNPNNIFTHLNLASVYVSLGRLQDARAEAKEVLRIHPKFSLDHYAKTLTLKDQSAIDEFVATLRKAGLK